jgi:hypothetical protein
MYRDTNNGWYGRWRERRRVERQEACERERRAQEQIDQLLAAYPVDRSRHAKTGTSSNRGLAGHVSGYRADGDDLLRRRYPADDGIRTPGKLWLPSCTASSETWVFAEGRKRDQSASLSTWPSSLTA